MKSLRKAIAMMVALGTLATSGATITASADDTIKDTKLYPCGDANFDGKINAIDVILLKKVVLGLAQPTYMYADGDTIKIYEETQPVIKSIDVGTSEYTVDVNTQTINIKDLALTVTSETVINGASSLDELSKLESGHMLSIKYDETTKKIVSISVFMINIQPLQTINFRDYKVTINADKTVTIKGLDLTLSINDNTNITLDNNIVTFDELFKTYTEPFIEVSLQYYEDSKIVNSISAMHIDGFSTVKVEDYELYINAKDSFITIPEMSNLRLYVTDKTTFKGVEGVTSLSDLNSKVKITEITYCGGSNKVSEISVEEIPQVNISTIYAGSLGDYYISAISVDDSTITLKGNSTNDAIILTFNDDTKFGGVISSIDDMRNNFAIELHYVIDYNSDTNVILSIYAEPIESPNDIG